jgi:hypothetical protein
VAQRSYLYSGCEPQHRTLAAPVLMLTPTAVFLALFSASAPKSMSEKVALH